MVTEDKNSVTVTRTMLRAGQPRPYADSIYEAILTIRYGDGTPVMWQRGVIEPLVKALVHNYETTQRQWMVPYLHYLDNEKTPEGDKMPGVWRAIVIDEYKD